MAWSGEGAEIAYHEEMERAEYERLLELRGIHCWRLANILEATTKEPTAWVSLDVVPTEVRECYEALVAAAKAASDAAHEEVRTLRPNRTRGGESGESSGTTTPREPIGDVSPF